MNCKKVRKKETMPSSLGQIAYIILPAAVALALIIGIFVGNLVEKITLTQNVNLVEDEYFLHRA